jgi:hypothetical protein
MTPYLMFIIFGFQATYIQFPSQQDCLEAKTSLTKELENPKVAIGCFEKLGGHNKDS